MHAGGETGAVCAIKILCIVAILMLKGVKNLIIEDGKYGNCNICLNSGHTILENEIIIPISIMKTGVYNQYLKTPEDLSRSARWWEGIPIVIRNQNDISGHPESIIVTAKTYRIGQVRDARWDSEKERLIGNAHIDITLCPQWLLNDLESGEIKGVSGTYFTDLIESDGEKDGKPYIAIETNYVPNNIAIVSNPACTPQDGCGLNMNEKISVMEENKMTNEITTKTEDRTAEFEKKIADMEVQMNSMKQLISEKDSLIAGYEKAKKESEFLAQFPVENQAAAKAELLPIFMEDPAKLVVMNSKRLGELLVPQVAQAAQTTQAPIVTNTVTEESKGSEHVDIELPEMNESKEIEDMVPSTDKIIEMIRGKRV